MLPATEFLAEHRYRSRAEFLNVDSSVRGMFTVQRPLTTYSTILLIFLKHPLPTTCKRMTTHSVRQQPHLLLQSLDPHIFLVLLALALNQQPVPVKRLVAEKGQREGFEQCSAVSFVERGVRGGTFGRVAGSSGTNRSVSEWSAGRRCVYNMARCGKRLPAHARYLKAHERSRHGG